MKEITFKDLKNDVKLIVISDYNCFSCQHRSEPATWEFQHSNPSDYCELTDKDISVRDKACNRFAPNKVTFSEFYINVNDKMIEMMFNKLMEKS